MQRLCCIAVRDGVVIYTLFSLLQKNIYLSSIFSYVKTEDYNVIRLAAF